MKNSKSRGGGESMSYYISIGEFQKYLTEHYKKTGRKMTFPAMCQSLYERKLLLENPVILHGEPVTDEEFYHMTDELLLKIDIQESNPIDVRETDIIPEQRDVLIIRQFRDIQVTMHTHDFFEIDYVAKGECEFFFNDGSQKLSAGEFAIIPPKLLHEILLAENSISFCILLRRSTFDTAFFSMLSRNDALSIFFRNTLQKGIHENFLLFYTDNNRKIKQIIQNAYLECYKNDLYGNFCCISWLNILFSELLRNYSKSLQFYSNWQETDFSLLMQYIHYNYRTVTLSFLAELFHYNESYLSTLIKENTGFSFSEIIKRQRLAEAEKYLKNTSIKIGEIAELVGYHSADHFSRVFRSEYQISPQEYRKKNKADEPLNPFFNT